MRRSVSFLLSVTPPDDFYLTGRLPSLLPESSLVPSVSDADFRARATFHRTRGHGIQEAYDMTLGLLGATTIDGVTINFKVGRPCSTFAPVNGTLTLFELQVSDAYLNEESLNYSESLLTPSGVTGYRYDNRCVSQSSAPQRSLAPYLTLPSPFATATARPMSALTSRPARARSLSGTPTRPLSSTAPALTARRPCSAHPLRALLTSTTTTSITLSRTTPAAVAAS